jgi:adenosylcobinamide-GDP ribazoletransferase
VLLVLAAGFMLSRTFSGIGVVTFPKAKADGTVAEFSRKSEDRIVRMVLCVYLVILLAFMLWVSPVLGAAAFAGALLIFVWYYHMAMKYFGGTTGDLSGFFLCLCELGMALILAVVSAIIY